MTSSMKVILSLVVICTCLLEVFSSEELAVEPRYQYHPHNAPSSSHTAPKASAVHSTKSAHARSSAAVTDIRKALAATEFNLIKILRNLHFKEAANAKCSTEKILEFYQVFLQALREEAACLPALDKANKANAHDFDLSASKKRIEKCQSKTDPKRIASCVAIETLSEAKRQLRALSRRWNIKLDKDLADKIGVLHDCHKKAMAGVQVPVDALKKNLVACREKVQEKVKEVSSTAASAQEKGKEVTSTAASAQEKVQEVASTAAPAQEKVKKVASLTAPAQEKVKEVASTAAPAQEKVKEVASTAAHV